MRGRWLRILLGGVLAAGGVFFGSRVHFDGDISRLLPDSDPALRTTSAVVGKAMQRLVIDLSLPDGEEGGLDVLMLAADQLAAKLEESEFVTSAQAAMLDDGVIDAIDLLVDSVPSLLAPADYSELERRLEPAAITESLAQLKRRAHEPDAALLLSAAPRDPLGFSALVLTPMEDMLGGLRDVRLVNGYITTADGAHLLMFVEPAVDATDTTNSLELLADLEAAVAEVQGSEEFARVSVRHLGAHRSTLDNQQQIERDVILTTSVGAVFVAVIAVLTLARTWWGLLAMTPALFGAAMALGTVSFFRDSIAAPVVGLGVALLGISIDYSIHVLYRLNSGGDARLPVRALFMGATTTAFAFLALGVSSMPALREVGMLGAIGIVASAVFAVVVLPALAGVPKEECRPRFDLRARFARREARTGRGMIVAALIATVLLAFGVTRLEFDGDVSRLSSLSTGAAEDDAGIKEVWGEAFQVTQVVVSGDDFQNALQTNDSLRVILEQARAQEEIRNYGSISSFLPTLEEQAGRLASWRVFWSSERVERTRADLKRACDELGYEAATFEPFFSWIASDPAPLEYAYGDSGPMASLVSERVLQMGDELLITTPVFVESWQQVEALRARLGEALPRAIVINNQSLSRKLAEMVVGELWKLGLSAFVAVVLSVLLWLRSLRHTLLVVIPLVVSSIWTLGALGWLGIPINLANSVFAAFLFGIAVDYSIFMVQVRIERARGLAEDLAETDSSVLLCALTTCIGFGALAAAQHPVLHSIGVTALAGIMAAFLATRVFVPWLSGLLLKP